MFIHKNSIFAVELTSKIVNTTFKSFGLYFIIYFIGIFLLLRYTTITYESYSAKSLEIVNYWNKTGIVQSKFIPTYSLRDSNSSEFFLSHPPLSYYFLFAFNKLVRSEYFYILNFGLILISALFIYLTIALLTLKKAKTEYSKFGFIGVILYSTHPAVINYQLLNFHPDIFVNTLLVILSYILVKVMMKNRYNSIKYLVLFSLVVFLLNYSSWFGVIYSTIICIIGLFNLRRTYKFVPYLLLTIGIVSSTILLIYTQYAYVGGWKNVILYFKDTYIQESFLKGGLGKTGFQIMVHVLQDIGSYVLIIAILVLSSIHKRKQKFIFTKNGYRYLFLSILPIVFYSIIFIQYFQNSFTSLYFIPALSVILSIWIEKIFKNELRNAELVKIVSLIVLSNISLFAIFKL